jgi:hypothetical protein
VGFRASWASRAGRAGLARHGWPNTAGLAGMETPLKREYSKVDNKKKDETMHEFFNGHFTHSVRRKIHFDSYFHRTRILIALALLNSIKKLRQLLCLLHIMHLF